MKKTIAIIPARYDSTRFPGKPLKPIAGKALILNVIERIKNSELSDIMVATDDKRIKETVENKKICRVIMTKEEHSCGTDRIAEIANKLEADYILNVQGDQLVKGPEMINSILEKIDDGLQLSTLYTDIKDHSELKDENVVKVIVNSKENISYMSRCPIPFDKGTFKEKINYYKQIGIYVFNRKDLIKFSKLKPTNIEHIEGIELLRAIDYDIPLRGIYSDFPTIDVDVPADIDVAEKFIHKFPIR